MTTHAQIQTVAQAELANARARLKASSESLAQHLGCTGRKAIESVRRLSAQVELDAANVLRCLDWTGTD